MPSADQITPPTAGGEGDKAASSSPEMPENPIVAVPPAPTPVSAVPEPEGKKPAPPPVDVTASVAKQLLAGELGTDEPAKPEKPEKSVAQVEPVVELPDVPHPMDAEDDPRDADIDGRASEKTRTAFDRLRGRLRQAREEGQFGAMLIDVAQSNGLDPDTVGSLITLAAKAKTGDAEAADRLQTVLTKLGAFKPAAAVQPIDAETLLLVEAEKVYRRLFAADVEAADIAESTARNKARLIAEENLKTKALSQPVPPEPKQAPRQERPPQPPESSGLSPMEAAASGRVNSLVQKYTDAYKKSGADFAPVLAAAREIIMAKAKAEGPINPLYWEYELAQAVRSVQSKKAAAQAPAQPKSESLRPSSRAAGSEPAKDFRADIVSKLVSGRLDDL